MRSFASDNNSGVHPLVMEALSRANADHALGYGDDRWTEEAVAKIKETFTQDCVPLFVFNGTGSNARTTSLEEVVQALNDLGIAKLEQKKGKVIISNYSPKH